jgi:OFA family oxalate/formate antiporter-like MFS transporter
LTYGIGSLGVGIIYATAVGTANRWFPDRRGLATGLTAFGFGSGAAIMNPVISWIMGTQGFRAAFLSTGIVMLLALTILGFVSRYPNLDWTTESARRGTKRIHDANSFKPSDMVKTTSWWLVYAAFILTSQTGLLITSQAVSLGDSFRIPQDTILLATILFPIANSLGRIIGGYTSDRLGRQIAMVSFFTVQGLLALFLLFFGSNSTAFFATIALIGFFWGPIFTFFPSLIGDYYGQEYSTSNTAITYTAKAWGGWIGGYIAAFISSLYGFAPVIFLSMLFSFTASILVSPYVLRKPVSLISESPP